MLWVFTDRSKHLEMGKTVAVFVVPELEVKQATRCPFSFFGRIISNNCGITADRGSKVRVIVCTDFISLSNFTNGSLGNQDLPCEIASLTHNVQSLRIL